MKKKLLGFNIYSDLAEPPHTLLGYIKLYILFITPNF